MLENQSPQKYDNHNQSDPVNNSSHTSLLLRILSSTYDSIIHKTRHIASKST